MSNNEGNLKLFTLPSKFNHKHCVRKRCCEYPPPQQTFQKMARLFTSMTWQESFTFSSDWEGPSLCVGILLRRSSSRKGRRSKPRPTARRKTGPRLPPRAWPSRNKKMTTSGALGWYSLNFVR
jgi:hypothetical protein